MNVSECLQFHISSVYHRFCFRYLLATNLPTCQPACLSLWVFVYFIIFILAFLLIYTLPTFSLCPHLITCLFVYSSAVFSPALLLYCLLVILSTYSPLHLLICLTPFRLLIILPYLFTCQSSKVSTDPFSLLSSCPLIHQATCPLIYQHFYNLNCRSYIKKVLSVSFYW